MKRRSLVFLISLLMISFGNLGHAADAVEMKVRGVTMDPERHSPIVILEDSQGARGISHLDRPARGACHCRGT